MALAPERVGMRGPDILLFSGVTIRCWLIKVSEGVIGGITIAIFQAEEEKDDKEWGKEEWRMKRMEEKSKMMKMWMNIKEKMNIHRKTREKLCSGIQNCILCEWPLSLSVGSPFACEGPRSIQSNLNSSCSTSQHILFYESITPPSVKRLLLKNEAVKTRLDTKANLQCDHERTEIVAYLTCEEVETDW